jgi:hypothetical protein
MWVENMNSVMDDNRLLTLPNGERIRLEDHVKLLVEVYDLQVFSFLIIMVRLTDFFNVPLFAIRHILCLIELSLLSQISLPEDWVILFLLLCFYSSVLCMVGKTLCMCFCCIIFSTFLATFAKRKP